LQAIHELVEYEETDLLSSIRAEADIK